MAGVIAGTLILIVFATGVVYWVAIWVEIKRLGGNKAKYQEFKRWEKQRKEHGVS